MMNFLPVGFQYYRAPTPLQKNWASDLKKLREDGFNTVKYWLQWRWNEPEEGVFDFSDVDALMDLAAENGLKVVLNIILDVAPVWLFERFSDAHMITNSGEKLLPRATEYRQIGGAPGPCLHHPEATALRMRFVEQCAARYADHPALWVWDVWNEPELSVGIKREPLVPDLLCYCEHSIGRFRTWLEKKYGTISGLNARWGRNYRSFAQAEAPRRRGTTADMIDWRLFFNDTITEDYRLRVEAVKRFDGAHPVMCHTVPPPLFNGVSCCSDDFALGRIGDMFGNSVGSSALASNILRSAVRDKDIINSEVHAVYGSSLNGFHRPDFNDMLRHIFIPMTNGVKGWLFWQYRPEILGSESPAWGSVDLKGRDTPWHRDLKEILGFLKRHETLILADRPHRGKVGICLSKRSEIYSWIATHGTEVYDQSLQGVYSLLRRSNLSIEFFTDEELETCKLSGFELVWFPAAFCMTPEQTAAVADYTAQGGTAVFEAFAGMINLDTGLHEDTLPGCGLAELSGVELDSVFSTAMIENAYDWKLVMNVDSDEISMRMGEIPMKGAKYLLRYSYADAEVLAEFSDGTPAVFRRKNGAGSVVQIATLFGAAYERYACEGNAALVERLIQSVRPDWKTGLPFGLRGDQVGGEKGFLILENTLNRPISFRLPAGWTRDVFKRCGREADGFILAPQGIAVFERE